jgi:hypothetical protein
MIAGNNEAAANPKASATTAATARRVDSEITCNDYCTAAATSSPKFIFSEMLVYHFFNDIMKLKLIINLQ